MSATTLETALRARGISCTVEAHDRLAVLVPHASPSLLEDPAIRREAVALLREHGFTHLALELLDEPAGDAAVHRR